MMNGRKRRLVFDESIIVYKERKHWILSMECKYHAKDLNLLITKISLLFHSICPRVSLDASLNQSFYTIVSGTIPTKWNTVSSTGIGWSLDKCKTNIKFAGHFLCIRIVRFYVITVLSLCNTIQIDHCILPQILIWKVSFIQFSTNYQNESYFITLSSEVIVYIMDKTTVSPSHLMQFFVSDFLLWLTVYRNN